jgi:intracellular septation protein A
MALSISFVLVLGILVAVLIRSKAVKVGPAVVCVLFGFFLASTSMAPTINRFLTGVADMVGQLRF